MSDELYLIDDEVEESSQEKFNILIVDDEEAVHKITAASLKDKVFDGRKLNIISAMSAMEAKKILKREKDIALALIDVVMETPKAGLNLIDYIRKDLNNNLTRLVLRTGQPDQVPEEEIIDLYDINDYKEKTELTSQKLYTLVRTSLKQYQLIKNLENEVIEISNELDDQKLALDEHAIVAITDTKGNITYANEKFSQISGYSNDELIGQNHRIIKSGKHDKSFWKNMYDAVSHGDIWKGEVCNRNKNGNLYWVNTTIVPFTDPDGNIKSYVSIRADITKQKDDQAKMLEAKQIAEDAVLEKSEFFACMSHEIRTPMNGIIGMLDLIKRSDLNEQQTHQILIAESSAHLLLTIINDILDFSKIEAGKIEIENSEFNLRNELGQITKSLCIKAEENNVEIILDLSKIEYTTIKSDSVRLRQIINNIVGNAIKFTTYGHIIINAGLDPIDDKEAILKLEISDTGIGIPEDRVATLFDSFSQVDSSTTRKYGGTGLGLSITKKLCELMNGSISVSSKLHQGSTFHLEIKVELGNNTERVEPDSFIKGKSVLIVDNSEINSQMLKTQLELWGMNVSIANNSQEALSMCESSSEIFDMAFIDMHMPNVNGIELSFDIRQDNNYKDMKLVLMTRIDSKVNLEHLQKLGVNAFISKPLITEDLFHALRVLDTNNKLISRDFKNKNLDESEKINWPNDVKILLVDDNIVNQSVAEEMLLTMGLKADIASNGEEAIEMLKNAQNTSPYTLILMDCFMPIMDGYQATQEIRNAKAGNSYINIPIIAMTANVLDSDKEKSKLSGMNDYLEKPITRKLFIEMHKKWILIEKD